MGEWEAASHLCRIPRDAEEREPNCSCRLRQRPAGFVAATCRVCLPSPCSPGQVRGPRGSTQHSAQHSAHISGRGPTCASQNYVMLLLTGTLEGPGEMGASERPGDWSPLGRLHCPQAPMPVSHKRVKSCQVLDTVPGIQLVLSKH